MAAIFPSGVYIYALIIFLHSKVFFIHSNLLTLFFVIASIPLVLKNTFPILRSVKYFLCSSSFKNNFSLIFSSLIYVELILMGWGFNLSLFQIVHFLPPFVNKIIYPFPHRSAILTFSSVIFARAWARARVQTQTDLFQRLH